MTLYQDERAYIAGAEAKATKAAKRKSRKIWALAAVGTLFAGGGAAFAAVLLTGQGSATAVAYQSNGLAISDAAFSKKLYPGATADLKFKVTNPNPYAVKVTSVGAEDAANPVSALSAFAGKCGPAGGNDIAWLSTSLILDGTGTYSIPATDQVSVPANGAAWVTLPSAVTLSADANDANHANHDPGCAFTVTFKVTGTSGN